MLSLTPSHIIEYLYCPRFTYFEHVLKVPQYETKSYKVMRGRRMHDERLERNKAYLRRRIGVRAKHLDVYLTNPWLRGRVDEVLELEDGSMAPLDYKFAEYEARVYKPLQTQLFCYAWLIREQYGVPVTRGYLVYIRSKYKLVEVPVSEADISSVQTAAAGIERIVVENIFPKATRDRQKCVHCTYRNICIQ